MKIVSIVGARPEFIQAAPLSRELRKDHVELLVHTGQHYDYRMSQTFFDELGIPAPDYNLEVGSGSHARQTAEILTRLEEVLLKEQPNLVIVRGDTNSTLAGALAASKLQIPSVHIEAGERSFDRRMPEEINRLVADRLSDVFFCVSKTAVHHLKADGIETGVFWVGDVMLDAMLANHSLANEKSQVLQQQQLESKSYALMTVHRAANTDDPLRLAKIVEAVNSVSETVIFPAHPRTHKALQTAGLSFGQHVRVIEPVGYYDMMMLEENARLIATDSGGVQREAYFLGVPCITLRDETEWVETVEVGWNRLVGVEPEVVRQAWASFQPPAARPPIFGDGTASRKIVEILETNAPVFGGANRHTSTNTEAQGVKA
ncbi:MAG TPA: UDP-N-acetylglucosamine 2-epimerase (non-hydrolyzing) [Anaerolinea sp.]|mgnify:CR=1 FL=1|nr:UDP-N-acetylglucosamine 2-epimerase (non-hydrolyzing) [Anaerolinea sp.]